jgi:FkbM family methyltransferase
MLRKLFDLHFGDWSRAIVGGPLATRINIEGRTVPIELRPNPSDVLVFAEVMLRDVYAPLFDQTVGRTLTWIDIGAHIGTTTLYAAARCRSLIGVCVEPVFGSARLLERNLALNELDVQIERAAISDANGSSVIYGTTWWSSCTTSVHVRDGRLQNARRPENTLRVPDETVHAICMESLLEKYNIDDVDILKFDAEGAEAVVFAKPAPWMRRVRRIGLDLHARYINSNRVLEVLKDAGFSTRAHSGPLVVLER